VKRHLPPTETGFKVKFCNTSATPESVVFTSPVGFSGPVPASVMAAMNTSYLVKGSMFADGAISYNSTKWQMELQRLACL
jgi:hypothetical protein